MIIAGCRHLRLQGLCLLLPRHHQGGGQSGGRGSPHHPAEVGAGGEELGVARQGDHDLSLQRDPAGADSSRKDPTVEIVISREKIT